MRNRAKCKLCADIIESLSADHIIDCKCEEITIFGGDKTFGCRAKNWDNFLRVDDEGNEIVITVKNEPEKLPKLTREDLLKMLDAMNENIEKLPQHAMTQAVNQYDLSSLIILISAILRSKE